MGTKYVNSLQFIEIQYVIRFYVKELRAKKQGLVGRNDEGDNRRNV
ncbi:hypothetical protein Ppha_2230 [Pelodictyon phaeoclathratiforme BU-1]|uniref:Uncharacterized protein n=1 Tax=Pelodictyon phaeoclathratiforme (strain DSM 5477 / BU-1) TaxID=324925 RepID=B4SDQ9_PELPB|nr:hypothetical protein Ppha_2230 [Pelodictyon phaeoclathratiforme BU-1]